MKKFLIIIGILSSLLIFWCNKNPQITDMLNTWDKTQQNIENITWNTINLSWTQQNNMTWATSWDIQTIIDQYKTKETGDSDKLNENDIDLMEKIIEEIEKK